MSIFNFKKYNKTNFKAGGLVLNKVMMSAENTLSINNRFIAPRKIDCRDLCIETSHQYNSPHCAGFATAGFIEVRNWKINHYPEQIDGHLIYNEAKKFDNMPGDGTTLECAAKAAINLNLISGKIKYIDCNIQNMMFAIHTNSVFIGGFAITDEWNRVDLKTGEISNFENGATALGGHAVLVCGYDQRGIYIQNSWGYAWGLYGYALIPWPLVSKQFMYGVVIV
jgi:hypothetical protein